MLHSSLYIFRVFYLVVNNTNVYHKCYNPYDIQLIPLLARLESSVLGILLIPISRRCVWHTDIIYHLQLSSLSLESLFRSDWSSNTKCFPYQQIVVPKTKRHHNKDTISTKTEATTHINL